MLDDGAKNAVKAILETGSKSEKPVQLYDLCMDTATVNSHGAAPLLPLLRSLSALLQSPSLPAESSVAFLHKRGVSSFFNVYVDADPVEPTRYSLTMEQGGMTLPTKDYYVTAKYNSVRAGFLAFVEKVFTALSLDKNTDLTAAAIVSSTGIVAAIAGSWIASRMNDAVSNFLFAVLLIFIAGRMLLQLRKHREVTPIGE